MIMSRNHKVMHISCLHPWNDTRILFREAKTLSKEHDVELHAVADFKTRVYEGVIIVGLRKKIPWLRPIQWFILGWRSLRNSATVVHLHDPELLLLGLVLCFFGKKVIYDVHEDVYEDILNKDWIPKPLRLIIAKIYLFFHKLSDIHLSAIVTATPTIAKQFQNRQLVVVRNYPPLDVYSNNGQDFTSRKMHYPVRLIYVGTINRTRGVLNIVRALHHIPKGFEYRLDIVGSFADGRNFEIEVMEAAAVFSNMFFKRSKNPPSSTSTPSSTLRIVSTSTFKTSAIFVIISRSIYSYLNSLAIRGPIILPPPPVNPPIVTTFIGQPPKPNWF